MRVVKYKRGCGMNKFIYNVNNPLCDKGIKSGLSAVYKTKQPVIVCIGSDLAIGDSLGPLLGTFLQEKLQGKAYVYGTLTSPVTAKEAGIVSNTIKQLHPSSKILAIDAGVGDKSDVGLVKVIDYGIKPGLGVNKKLPTIGDASIIGIVAEKQDALNNIFSATRLSLIYKMSSVIATAITSFLEN